tara:strand:- start:3530 stop:5203 length:1674 start_codon:yes stop_codon:yes gene_type:complete
MLRGWVLFFIISLSYSNENIIDNEYLDMLEKSLIKLNSAYVDSIDADELIKSGIKGMLKPLDPYTKLLVGSSKDKLDMLRTGKYGGVGIQIGNVFDTLTVLNTFEDSPAYLEGLHIGDQIFKIDSTKTKGMKISEIVKLIKGELGTEVVLHIFRPYTKQRLEFSLTRSNIQINDVPYWGVDENNIAYIRVNRFSKNTGKDFRKALLELKESGMQGLVIDLRSNSGGLLSNAISMLDKIVNRGSVLLKTKGRLERSNKTFSSRAKPIIDSDIPIAVLINKSSASASEIFAGVLQDYDRAVIIGQKSFGKGLVQSMFNLNDTTTLKITTAKYYTPSGRLIQKQDYMKDGFFTDGLDTKDSIFVTLKNNRSVYGGGGITPDVTTEVLDKTDYIKALWRKKMFLKFASIYVPQKSITAPIIITDKMLSDFKVFVDEYDLSYSLPGEKELNRMKDKLLSYSKDSNKKSLFDKILFLRKSKEERLINNLNRYYKKEKKAQFYNPLNYPWIINGLQREMSMVVEGKKEQMRVSLYEDGDYLKAVDILKDANQYYDILSGNSFEQ